ncbi:hypothetical protein GCM10011613_28620 [Cellvibrio zantedeschiae]|uniref:Fibronectin type-III domain-containing protein n=1 Tax=Cellvibrio zantedeschiae TaxID=1237077 RepID=A0ABQ3BAU5_9GAMM|nr:hypothetical protein [Cellvibrio zantedeschiae]GGY82166.1 hypothetical protein GCM10011613_28620 [Cellvibrio zantedeschiae]
MKNKLKIQLNLASLATIFILALSSCGGGGGSTDTGGGFNSTPNNTKPQASDSAVASSVLATQESSAPAQTASSQVSSATSSRSSSVPGSSSSRRSISSSSLSSRASNIDQTPPSIPANFRVETAQSDRVVLAWAASTDNNSGTISYKIYRDQVQIDTIRSGDVLYYDFDVAPSKSYTYSISAGDTSENWSGLSETTANTAAFGANSSAQKSSASSNSSKSSAGIDLTLPTAPTQVTKVNAYSTQVEISWNAGTDNIGVTAYRVYRDSILIKTLTADITTFIDKTVAPDISYWYGVSAGDAAGNWSSQKLINIKTPLALVSGNVTLKWLPPTQRENLVPLLAADIGGYEIRYKALLESTYTYKTVSKDVDQITLQGLIGDYAFEIAAFDTHDLYSPFTSIKPQ